MRLAAVLAEIAQNEANCTLTVESVCSADDKVKQDGENPLGSHKK
jgi:hypothetical protein